MAVIITMSVSTIDQNVEQPYTNHHDREILGIRHSNQDVSARYPLPLPRSLPNINLLSSISPNNINAWIQFYKQTGS